jgi:hypothetical protein
MRLLLGWLLFLLSGFCLLGTSVVQACSGGFYSPTTLQEEVEASDVVVKATVVEVDDYGQNALLHIDEYLAGTPAGEFLLYYQTDPALTRSLMRYEDERCIYLHYDYRPGLTGYFFLVRQPNGTYSIPAHPPIGELEYPLPFNPQPIYVFSPETPEATIYLEPPSLDDSNEVVVTETEFRVNVDSITDAAPQLPDKRLPFPRKTPLKITTSNGTNYLFPVDGGEPVPMPRDSLKERFGVVSDNYSTCKFYPCISLSPDEVSVAMWRDSGLCLTDTTEMFANAGCYYTGIEAQAFLFAPTSDKVLIWNKNQLIVYRIAQYDFRVNPFYSFNLVDRISTADAAPALWCSLRSDCVPDFATFTNYYGQAVWCPDGGCFAYNDASGISVVNLSNSDFHTLVIERNDVDEQLEPLYFSPSGRYLVYRRDSALMTIDLLNNVPFREKGIPAAGVFAPDESLMLVRGDMEGNAVIFQCYLPYASYNNCPTYPSLFHGYKVSVIREVHWINPVKYLVIGCQNETEASCEVYYGHPADYTSHLFLADDLYSGGFTLVYESHENLIAIAAKPATIFINTAVNPFGGSGLRKNNLVSYDLQQYLDSDIASIEWMPSLFFNWDN